MSNTAATTEHPEVVGKLSTLDRYLAVWIGVAMVVGLLVGRWIPGVNTALDKVQIDGISLPIALGLLIMMYRSWRRSATTASTQSPGTRNSSPAPCS